MNQAAITKSIFKNDTIPQKGTVISEAVISLSKRFVMHGRPILDMGAGSGALISRLAKKYEDCFGLDLFPKGSLVKYGDITSTHLQDCSVGTIFCTDVIEHLSDTDLDSAISEMHRILIEGGYAIITTIYNEDLLRNYTTCPECNHRFHHRGHCQVFSKERVRGLFNAFEIAELRILKLHLEVTFGLPLAKLFYLFRMHKLIKFHEKDLFFVVRKSPTGEFATAWPCR